MQPSAIGVLLAVFVATLTAKIDYASIHSLVSNSPLSRQQENKPIKKLFHFPIGEALRLPFLLSEILCGVAVVCIVGQGVFLQCKEQFFA